MQASLFSEAAPRRVRHRSAEAAQRKAVWNKAWRLKNAAALASRRKAYRQRHREKEAACTKAWKQRNREKVAALTKAHQLAAYGMSWHEYQRRLDAQGGACAICRTEKPGGNGRWHVDHDHRCCPRAGSCGRCVRGLLCLRCNLGLGYFGDSAERLLAAYEYLGLATSALGVAHVGEDHLTGSVRM